LLHLTSYLFQDELTEEETGWKMISGDVFRSPDYLSLFCACIGSGAQLFATALVLLSFVLFGVFKATRRGALLTAAIVIYAVAGSVGGFVAARLFKQLKGLNWVWNVVLTSFLFPTPLFLVFCWVNGVAWTQQSTAALPLTTILVMTYSSSLLSSSPLLVLVVVVDVVNIYLCPLPFDRCWCHRWKKCYGRLQTTSQVE
jgi:transmembrane 9 superfamily member 1